MKAVTLTDNLYNYVVDHSRRPSPVLKALEEETAKLPMARMQIAGDQGSFLFFIAKLIGARRILEVGCFTGYSSICMATALPEQGRLVTLDISKEYTDIARKYWERAGLTSKIDLKLAPALESLETLIGKGEQFDLMFIDADKENMVNYYEAGLKLLRPGGLLVADNVLWGGSVVDSSNQETSTKAVRAFNEKVKADIRVDSTMLYMADGLFLVRKH
jgi:predicted O-methyltransferase YrrM